MAFFISGNTYFAHFGYFGTGAVDSGFTVGRAVPADEAAGIGRRDIALRLVDFYQLFAFKNFFRNAVDFKLPDAVAVFFGFGGDWQGVFYFKLICAVSGNANQFHRFFAGASDVLRGGGVDQFKGFGVSTYKAPMSMPPAVPE